MRIFAVVLAFSYRRMVAGWVVWMCTGLAVAAVGALALVSRGAGSVGAGTTTLTDGVGVGYCALFVTYVLTLLCGGVVTTSMALERVSGVTELLVHRVRPLVLVHAKLGALAVVVAQTVLLAVATGAALAATGVLDLAPLRATVRTLGLSGSDWVVVAVSVLVAMALYTTLYAICGLLVTDEAQLQFAQLPVSVVLVVSFVLAFVAVGSGGSTTATVALVVPTSAPLVLAGAATGHWGPPWAAAVGLAGAAGLVVLSDVVISRTLAPRAFRPVQEPRARRALPSHRPDPKEEHTHVRG